MGDPKQGIQPIKLPPNHAFDAIVVGSGISGGWAAKELCEKGLKTLLLERGRNVVHIKDYDTASLSPWQFPRHLNQSNKDIHDDPIQSKVYNEGSRAFFVRDQEHPYIQDKPYNWIRGYQVGGRSLIWGRQCYRLSDLDFTANLRDGHGVDWPLRYKDLAPWYDYVENFAGISGKAEGLAHLPDGQFLPAMEMNCLEAYFSEQIRAHYSDRIVTIGRVANLTRPLHDRGPCQFRNLCDRGCPFGGYFSSNAATIPAAEATGNLTLLPDSIATEVLYDEQKQRASGVRVLNQHSKAVTEYYGKIIFLNASTIATAALLLQSVSRRFPDGMGNSSGQVGHNLMDHFVGPGAVGQFDGLQDQYYSGRRPTGVYIPRYRNLNQETLRKDYVRGFGCQAAGERMGWDGLMDATPGFGKEYKDRLLKPGPWTMWIGAWGETLPYFENRVMLDKEKKDPWGLPLVRIHAQFQDNEKAMMADAQQSIAEMLEYAGFKQINAYNTHNAPGSASHEMGTVRMGRDPKTSVLNGFNQMHDVPNVFVTDGSCMTSSACQNPSLTYMALTARAADYAMDALKRGNL
jgi:choline dehydrogenase-like flavoprotein